MSSNEIFSYSSFKTFSISATVGILSIPLLHSILFLNNAQICSIRLKSGEFAGESYLSTLCFSCSHKVNIAAWDGGLFAIKTISLLWHSGHIKGFATYFTYLQPFIPPFLSFLSMFWILNFFCRQIWKVFIFSPLNLASARYSFAFANSSAWRTLNFSLFFHSIFFLSTTSLMDWFKPSIFFIAFIVSSSVNAFYIWNGPCHPYPIIHQLITVNLFFFFWLIQSECYFSPFSLYTKFTL